MDFANHFQARISPENIKFFISYIEHGENLLFFETLCDYLCEEDVVLKLDEHKKLTQLGSVLGADLGAGRFKYLSELFRLKNEKNG